MKEIKRVRKETHQTLKEIIEQINEGKELGKSILIGYYFSVLMSGAVKIPGGEYKKETSVELEIPNMPEMPKGEEVLEIPENIEMEPETPGTEVKEIKPEEIEQEMKEIETEGGGITGTEILEGAERVLEGEKVEAVTEAENVLDVGIEVVEEVVKIVNGVGAEEVNKTDELVLKGISYSPEYAQKLKDTYKLFKSNGYEVSEHGLNRILGRINQGKICSIEDVLDVLNTGTRYIDTVNGGTVLFKNNISIHVSDGGFIKTVIGNARIKSTWEAI